MPSPTVTYTFSNSTTADATQVNQNFTDLINSLTDGTKDLSISALTVAGNATFTGSTITFGNSTSDTVVFTALVGSHQSPSAHNTYDLGTVTTLGYRAMYFASSSATKTAKLQGPAISGDITVTLPGITGTIEVVPVFSAKTGTYTTTASDRVITCDASGAGFTVNLVAAAGNTGLIQRFIKTDSSFNQVTLDGNSSETIRGATTFKLCTQHESVTLICDGSNWHIVEHTYPSKPTGYSLTIGGSGSAPTEGNAVTKLATWQRVGKRMIISFEYVQTNNSGAAAGSGTYLFPLPSGTSIDTALSTAGNGSCVGSAYAWDNSNENLGFVAVSDASNLYMRMLTAIGTVASVSSTNYNLTTVNVRYGFTASVAISDWEA